MTIKEKFVAMKEKAKANAPEIAVFAITLTALTIGVIGVTKQITAAGTDFEPLPTVDDETRKQLMENKDFLLYKLTDNEYLLDRPIAQQ